jgi:hypothetical protein
MTPLDLAVASAGRVALAIDQAAGGRRRVARWVVTILVLMSAIPVLGIGSSPRPTDLTFEDVRLERIPAMTSWVRLEGDLRPPAGGFGELYELHDLKDPSLYVYLSNASSLPLGRQVVTGRISPRAATTGNVGTLIADVPAVPKANEPFAVILFPAALGAFIAIGINAGYPAKRHEAPPKAAPRPLAPGTSVSADWSGRIGSEIVGSRAPVPARVAIQAQPDFFDVTLETAGRVEPHVVRTRRPAAGNRVRVCRIRGCQPALEIHAPTADLLLVFGDSQTRDRLAASLR